MPIDAERKKIDVVDSEILGLLNKRAQFAKAIGEEKRRKGMPAFDAEREKGILESLKSKNKGVFPDDALGTVFGEIISACRSLEQPLSVAFLGPETTFTHMAAIKKFGSSASFVAAQSIREVFDAVEKKLVDYGVVPVENSTEGTVASTLDTMLDYNLHIVGEILMEVKHNVLSKYELYEVKKLYSHPLAAAQCRRWIEANLPNVEMVDTSSTAKAAEQASLYIRSAAIASELAAKKYGLRIIAKSIEDSTHNFTRFIVLGRDRQSRSNRDKTSIVFSVKHEPGTLFKALEPFQRYNINLTKIESRPAQNRAWEYVFFVDFQGFVEDEKSRKALSELKVHTAFMRVLGSYPEEAAAK